MLLTKPTSPTPNAADAAMPSAQHPMTSTQHAADRALDSLAGAAQDLRQQVSPLLERAGEQAGALAQRGADVVRARAQQLRERTAQASDRTLDYIKDEPVKAVLIAAATGAAIAVLLGLLRKSG